jgi:MFS transporter, SHS family, lactate transporter
VPSPPSTMLCGGGGRSNTLSVLKSHWRLGIYAVLLMTAFNFFGHGTQGLYPIFVQVQHGFAPHEVGLIAVSYNIGAIIGGVSFGSLSERFGRRHRAARLRGFLCRSEATEMANTSKAN